MEGKKICMSGFRDNTISNFIENEGGIITTSVSKNTDLLLVKDDKVTSYKIDTATLLGIPIINKHNFINLYLN